MPSTETETHALFSFSETGSWLIERVFTRKLKRNKRKTKQEAESSDGSPKRKKNETFEKTKQEAESSDGSPKRKKNETFEKKSVSSTERCPECRQYLDNLKLYPVDPDYAEEERIVLTNPKLHIHIDGKYENHIVVDTVFKITNFCVYDRHRHICPFDPDLFKRDIELFFSGVVKPTCEEDPSISGGVFGCNFGPILQFFVTPYDGGRHALFGITTAFAKYILMNPNELYEPYMDVIKEQIHLSKEVIDLLIQDNEASYEDLLHKLNTVVRPQGSAFTEDILLHHVQFVVDQIRTYDSAREDNEEGHYSLITSPCARTLIDVSEKKETHALFSFSSETGSWLIERVFTRKLKRNKRIKELPGKTQ